jgi:hypothetical protein
MTAVAMVSAIIGAHVIFARTAVAKRSGYAFYAVMGMVEGIPLVAASLLLFAGWPYAMTAVVLGLAIYLFSGTPIKRRGEQNAEKQDPGRWKAWQAERSKLSPFEKMIFFL